MTAQDYPVTFGYGAQDGYYYGPNGIVGPYHRGNDREMQIGTPVKVGNKVIGLSGNSGTTGGPHLHIGAFKGTQDINPGPFEFLPGTVIATGYDPTMGNYIKIDVGGGVLTVYMHLSQINVNVGDKLGEEMPSRQDIQSLWEMILETYPKEQDFSYWSARSTSELIQALLTGADRKNKRKTDVKFAYKLGWNRDPEQKEYDFWTFRNISTLMEAIYKDPTSAVNKPSKGTVLAPGDYIVK